MTTYIMRIHSAVFIFLVVVLSIFGAVHVLASSLCFGQTADCDTSVRNSGSFGEGGALGGTNREFPKTGTLKMAVLLFDYVDSGPTSERLSEERLRQVMFDPNGANQKYFQTMSEGKLTVAGTVFPWKRLARDGAPAGTTTCQYPTDTEVQQYINDQPSLDLAQYDMMVVYTKSPCLTYQQTLKITKQADAYFTKDNGSRVLVKTVQPGELYQYDKTKTTPTNQALYVQNPGVANVPAKPSVVVPSGTGFVINAPAPHATAMILRRGTFSLNMPIVMVNSLYSLNTAYRSPWTGDYTEIPYIQIFVLWHETGHLLGLPHPFGYDCPAGVLWGPSCTIHDNFMNRFTVMYGGGAGTLAYSVPERAQLGWLDAGNLLTINTVGKKLYTINASSYASRATNTGKIGAAIVIPGSTEPAYYLEYKRPVNLDIPLTQSASCDPENNGFPELDGLFVYRRDGSRVVLVDATPQYAPDKPNDTSDDKNVKADKCKVTLQGNMTLQDAERRLTIGPIASVTNDAISFYVELVDAPRSPTIVTEPQDIGVKVGEVAHFAVVATGTPTLAYEWQRNGVVISGANSSSYTTGPLSLSDNGVHYRVRVSNGSGDVMSREAVLSVTSPTSLSKPDLVVSDLLLTAVSPANGAPQVGKAVQVRGRLSNINTQNLSARNFNLKITVRQNGVVMRGYPRTYYYTSFRAGQSVTPTVSPAFIPNATALYEIEFQADASNAVIEGDETNNRQILRFTFVTPAAPTITMSSGHAMPINASHTYSGATVSDQNGDLQSYSWRFASCPGTCPILSNLSGSLSGSQATVPGPTYTPTEIGDYRLVLQVTDAEGRTTTAEDVEKAVAVLPWQWLANANSIYDGRQSYVQFATVPPGVTSLALAAWAAQNNDTLVGSGSTANYEVDLSLADTCTITRTPRTWSIRPDVIKECHKISNLDKDWSLLLNALPRSRVGTYCNVRYVAATRKLEFNDSLNYSQDCGFAAFVKTQP